VSNGRPLLLIVRAMDPRLMIGLGVEDSSPTVFDGYGTRNAKYIPGVRWHAISAVGGATYVTLRMEFGGRPDA
jgi:hypothetical protein